MRGSEFRVAAGNDCVNFRKASTEDTALLLANKSETLGVVHKLSVLSHHDQREWLQDIQDSNNDYILLTSLGRTEPLPPFGVFKIQNIDWISRSAQIGYDVWPEHRKAGLGTVMVKCGVAFCAEYLNLSRLECEVLEYNLPSLKLLNKLDGWKQEGIKKSAIFKDGSYYDSQMWAWVNR